MPPHSTLPPTTGSRPSIPSVRTATVVAALLAAMLCALGLPAQDLQERRDDLGKRLRRMERAWAAAPADADTARAAASAAMQRAVAAFFSMNLGRAAAAVDDGYTALTDPAGDAVARRLLSLGANLSTRLVEPDGEFQLTIAPAYDAEDWPADLRPWIRIEGFGAQGGRTFPLTRALSAGSFATEGDHVIRIAAADHPETDAPADAAWREIATVQVSVVRDFGERIDALGEASDDDADRPELEAATLPHLHRILRGLARGDAFETDLPASRLLREAEQIATAPADAAPFYGDDRPGEFWLSVPTGRRALPVRLLVPARTGDEREPRPLVLALHGAGGSENLFFDGYGDGLVAKLARERGWYVCAPRAMPAGSAEALVDALASRFAIDRTRVFCVGHSMGAMTAVAAAQRFPSLFARVAPLGGGGNVTDGEALADVRFLVGVGDRDFALGGARGLARALERDACPVELKVYPGIEHMLVVQVALPDVFRFFER